MLTLLREAFFETVGVPVERTVPESNVNDVKPDPLFLQWFGR